MVALVCVCVCVGYTYTRTHIRYTKRDCRRSRLPNSCVKLIVIRRSFINGRRAEATSPLLLRSSRILRPYISSRDYYVTIVLLISVCRFIGA